MTEENAISLEKHVDFNQIEYFFEYGPMGMMEPKPGYVQQVYEKLRGKGLVKRVTIKALCWNTYLYPNLFTSPMYRCSPSNEGLLERGSSGKVALQKKFQDTFNCYSCKSRLRTISGTVY